jgi:hypothetical protein
MTTKLLYGYREGILTATISALAGHKHLVGSLVRYKLVSKMKTQGKCIYKVKIPLLRFEYKIKLTPKIFN